MVTNDVPGTFDGCVLRVGKSEDVFLVESIRSLDGYEARYFTLSGFTGVSKECLIDVNDVISSPVERVNIESYFSFREICPLCSHPSTESTVLFSVRQIFWNIEVRKCSYCGMAYKDPIANPMLLTHLYSEEYTHYATNESDAEEVSIHRSRVARLGKVRGRHLDYGCGAGSFVEAALLAGWDSFGGDPFLPDTIASSCLSGRLFKFDAEDPNAIVSAGKYDCISMWAVVEHLTSFKDTFAGLVSMLNPGGTIVFNSPNANSLIAKYSGSLWRMATLIEHVQFCTPTAIKYLAKEYGFMVKKLRICGSPFPLGRGSGQSDQGLGSLPFPIPMIMEHVAIESRAVPIVQTNQAIIKKVTLMSRMVRFLLGTNGTTGVQTFTATVIRQIIHSLHLGDHIEVTLRLK
jgi:hypothetical protein